MKDLLLYTAIIAATLSPTLSAAKPSQNNNVEHLIVTGTRSQQPSIQIPASVQIVTAEEIKLSGASNVIQILNAQAGIQVTDKIGNQGRGAAISMRGFGENSVNNVLVMVDGRKLNNPSLSGPDLSSIAMKDIERIEIIQGSAGSLYGDQATGGVINVITKQSRQFSANIEAGSGSDNYENIQGAVSQGFDNGFNYRLSAVKTKSDNYRDNNESNYSNALAKIGFDNKIISLFVEGQKIKDDLNLPGSLNAAQIRQNRKQTSSPEDESNRDTDLFRIGGSYQFNDSWSFLAEYGYRDEDSDGNLWGNFTNNTKVKTFEPRITGSIATENGDVLITTGVDFDETEYKNNVAFGNTEFNQDTLDIYAQVITPITQDIKLTVSARNSDFEGKNILDNTKFSDDLNVYRVGLAYQLSTDSRAFLSRDKGFRWANADENGLNETGIDFLAPQETTSWELGYEIRINSIYLSALIYDLKIDNEILYDPTADGPWGAGTGANKNLSESSRQGVVLSSIWDITESLNAQLNYSYVDAEITSGTYGGNTVPFVAKQTANLVLTYQFNKHWSFFADAQFTGKRYGASDDTNQSGELGGYTLFNANIRYSHNSFYAQLRANNLTANEYNGFESVIYDYAYPAAEDTYQLSIGYTY